MTDTESESKPTLTTEQNHQGQGDNIGKNKNTTNNHHAPVNNIQNQQTTINQYANLDVSKIKKQLYELTIKENDLSPEEIQAYLKIFSKAIEKYKQNGECSNITLRLTIEGSTKFILDGDEEDLQILAQLQASGELEQLLNELKPDDIPTIEVLEAKFVEDKKVIQKAELIKKIREHKNKIILARADLRGADLNEANLSWADLNRADLNRANLIGANLIGANLSGADLNRANLIGANLIGANLSGADLSGADLNRANLRGADLSGADLRGADLRDAEIDRQTQLDDKWRLVYEIVNNVRSNLDLHARDLSYAYLQSSYLTEANLIGANLAFSDLKNSQLQQADLSGANLTDTDLQNANLRETVFNYATVKGTKFGNNPGMTTELKRDLQAKGAIFADDFGAGDRELVKV